MEQNAVVALLQALAPDAEGLQVQQVVPLTGGWSADTFRVQATRDGSNGVDSLDLVVRRIPPDGVLAPYDVEREHRLLRALQASPIPVPAVFGCDPAGQYVDGPCIVTEFVHGESLSFFGQTTYPDDPRLHDYFATLAAIHSLDWAALGLDFLDEADDPIEAELRRTEVRLDLNGAVTAREREMAAWLRQHKPARVTKGLMHGDPNLANYLFADECIAAVLDWELAFIGDPRTDLGFFAAIQCVFGGAWQLDTASFLRGYAVANPDADLLHLDYFEALGLSRLAAFLQAAQRRRGMDVTQLRQRLDQRFDRIAIGQSSATPIG